ncbi:MAG: hypothetical protein V4640_12920 [Verrucomicrobiota bacterium]
MDLSSRPRLRDFESRIGTRFHVRMADGPFVGEWSLDACEPLPKPPLDILADAECFTLVWGGSANCPQALYEFEAVDGFKTLLFAVPVSADCMWVTVN